MKRKKVTRHFNWAKFWAVTASVLAICIVIGTVITLGTDATKKEYADTGSFKTRDMQIVPTDYGYKIINPYDSPIRILQLTDIHIGGGLMSIKNDRLAIGAVTTLVKSARPDLIVVTGDIAYPVPFQSGTINNMRAAEIFAGLMEKMGIPWVITFGNHDTEIYSMYSRGDILDYYASLPGCLLVKGPQDVFGYGNQIITLHNADESINTALVLIDSNSYVEGKVGINKYDIIHDDQVEWYRESIIELSESEDELVQSMMFFHIPTEEYKTAWELYQNGSDEVKYYFGDIREKITCSEVDSNIFETIVELGSTKAVFCGHDHVNDISFEYKGVRLTYGKSIDYLAYAWSGIIKKTEQRGATLIEIASDKSFEISTIRYSDLSEQDK